VRHLLAGWSPYGISRMRSSLGSAQLLGRRLAGPGWERAEGVAPCEAAWRSRHPVELGGLFCAHVLPLLPYRRHFLARPRR